MCHPWWEPQGAIFHYNQGLAYSESHRQVQKDAALRWLQGTLMALTVL